MGPHGVVVGVGNVLARDEGVGPGAIERLSARGVPEGVRLIDAATDLLGVMPELAEAERVIVIDAMRAGGRPGDLYRMTLEELERRTGGNDSAQLSVHDLGLLEAVRLARVAGVRIPPTVVFGVEPGEVALGEGLTPAVEEAMDRLVEAVANEMAEPGV